MSDMEGGLVTGERPCWSQMSKLLGNSSSVALFSDQTDCFAVPVFPEPHKLQLHLNEANGKRTMKRALESGRSCYAAQRAPSEPSHCWTCKTDS